MKDSIMSNTINTNTRTPVAVPLNLISTAVIEQPKETKPELNISNLAITQPAQPKLNMFVPNSIEPNNTHVDLTALSQKMQELIFNSMFNDSQTTLNNSNKQDLDEGSKNKTQSENTVSTNTSNNTYSTNSLGSIILYMLPLIRLLDTQNAHLAEQATSLANGASKILKSGASAMATHEKKLDDQQKKLQKKINKAHKLVGFLKIAVGAGEIGFGIFMTLKGIGSKNPADIGIGVTLFLDGALKSSAATAIMINPELENSPYLNGMSTYGLFFVAGDDAKETSMGFMSAIMIYSMATGVGEVATLMMSMAPVAAESAAIITLEVAMQMSAVILSAASKIVGAYFALNNMIKAINNPEEEISMQEMAASFGGVQGLVYALADISNLRDEIVKLLASSESLSKENAEQIEQLIDMSIYMAIAFVELRYVPTVQAGLVAKFSSSASTVPTYMENLKSKFTQKLVENLNKIVIAITLQTKFSQVELSADQGVQLSIQNQLNMFNVNQKTDNTLNSLYMENLNQAAEEFNSLVSDTTDTLTANIGLAGKLRENLGEALKAITVSIGANSGVRA